MLAPRKRREGCKGYFVIMKGGCWMESSKIYSQKSIDRNKIADYEQR